MHPRLKLFWIVIGFAVMVLSGCTEAGTLSGTAPSEGDRPTQGRTIRIAHQTDSSAILIARAKGWFEEEFSKDGTEVVYTRFIAGPPIMEAFSAGRQDVGIAGDMPPVAARATGVEVQAVAVASRNPNGYTVVVRKEAPFQSVEDLKGGTLAAQVGSAQYHYALLLLSQKGLSDQIRLVNIPLTELRTALESGTVDAIVGSDILAGTLELEGVGRVLPDSSGIKPGLSFYVARSGFAKENPDLVQRFLKVIRRVNEYIEANPTEAAALAEQETGWPAPVLEKVFRASDFDIPFRDEDIRQLESVRDFLRDTNVIRGNFAVEDLVNPQFATAVDQ